MQLITRLDLDGVVCTAMISEMETVHEIQFSNPKDVEDRMVDIDFGDAMVHLPFHPDAGMWFYNHEPAGVNPAMLQRVRGSFKDAPSVAHLVYDFYSSPKLDKYKDIIKEVDRIQSADLAREDILDPKSWVLVSLTMDPRFMAEREYGLMLIEQIRRGKSAEELLALEPVAKRVDRYHNDEEQYAKALGQFTKVQGNVVVTDFRQAEEVPYGNRFFFFTEHPEANVHIRIDPLDKLRVKASVSKSVINRTCKADVGQLMGEFGGGGVEGAGTCLLGARTADARVEQLVQRLKD